MIRAEIKRLINAARYSRDGLIAACRQDAPFRLEALASIIILPLAFYLGQTGVERALLAGSWLLVPIIELLNCGLEAVTDYATKGERHALAKKTKDVGSAAVLLSLVACAWIWACIAF